MRWKWILVIGIFLIIALMAAVYVFVATYDYNKLKPRIAQLVKDATGRKLNLSGEVNLDFGFSPALVVTDVTFANAPWGSQPQMIKVEKLQAQVRLLPLLYRDVQLRRIGLVGVEVLLETDPSGRGNWDLIAGDSSDKRGRSFKPAQKEQINHESTKGRKHEKSKINVALLTTPRFKCKTANRFEILKGFCAKTKGCHLLSPSLSSSLNSPSNEYSTNPLSSPSINARRKALSFTSRSSRNQIGRAHV